MIRDEATHPRAEPDSADAMSGRAELAQRFRDVRAFTERLCEPLEIEDYVVQAMPDASPVKWHLAHTSWFFETFLLKPHAPGYREPDARYAYLFNSYYVGAGSRHCRDRRGMITRPTVRETYAYRAEIDRAVLHLLETGSDEELERAAPLVTLGLHHEQQHQELILTDIKYLLSANPLEPAYLEPQPGRAGAEGPVELQWALLFGGLREIGCEGGFCFDNESPRHLVYVRPFAIASRPVTNSEYCEFVDDGGYARPELWLHDGWTAVMQDGWEMPLYWRRDGRDDSVFTLAGRRKLEPHEPVCHVSYYEADAYARWRGWRLPAEAEWEAAAAALPIAGNFVESGRLHPSASAPPPSTSPRKMFGDVWEWTASSYSPYPGYRAAPGVLGEYNGKFMCNQFVLRGGSCATPVSHIRPTYRNFFHPSSRWQFSGIRLARDTE